MGRESKFVSAVVYIHNEQKNIGTYLRMLHSYLAENFTKFEIICVDDASSDNSVNIIRDIVKSNGLENVSLISMSIFQGRELGMEAGVDLSIGDYVYEFEWIDMKEMETYPNRLYDAYLKATDGYDVVTYVSGENKGLGSVVFYKIYNKSNLSYTELAPERFRLVTRRAINRVSNMNNSIVYRKALYANSGLSTCVIGSDSVNIVPEHKNVMNNKTKIGMNILLSYTGVIPKIATFIETVLFSTFVISTVLVLNNSIDKTIAVPCVVSSFIGSAIGALNIAQIKYNELLLELSIKNKKYVVSSVEKLINSEKGQEK